MAKYKQKYILKFLTQLLHPDYLVDKTYFQQPEDFWDNVVRLASSHLILPSLYSSLKRKKLESYAPKELLSYLKEITKLNRNRNDEVLNQIIFISDLFKKNCINYVFIKGSAIIISGPSCPLNERMIGDIDILVAEKHLSKAQNLLIDEGFAEINDKLDFVNEIYSHRHLKRITHPNYICAVELHGRLLDKSIINLNENDILSSKIQTIGGHWIPSRNYLWLHAIFNWQYNDHGYAFNNFSLRSYVDVVCLEPLNINDDILIDPVVSHFYSLCSVFISKYQNRNYISSFIFNLKLNNHTFQIIFDTVLRIKIKFIFLFNRFSLLLNSRLYRHRLLKNPKLFVNRILFFLKKDR